MCVAIYMNISQFQSDADISRDEFSQRCGSQSGFNILQASGILTLLVVASVLIF